MDRVDTLITKPLPYFWSFFFLENISWPHVNQVKIYNTSWNFKNKEARRGWACSKEKKTIRTPYFQISYLSHILFVLNNLKSYGNIIWSFTKDFWNAKTIKWRPKILSTIMQIGHMCQPTCPWPPSFREDIFCSFLHRFEWFCCIGCAIWSFTKKNWGAKTIKWCPKILSSKIQTSHMCQPHHARDPFTWKGISYSFLHWFEWFFFALDAPFETLQKELEVQRQ